MDFINLIQETFGKVIVIGLTGFMGYLYTIYKQLVKKNDAMNMICMLASKKIIEDTHKEYSCMEIIPIDRKEECKLFYENSKFLFNDDKVELLIKDILNFTTVQIDDDRLKQRRVADDTENKEQHFN